MEQDKKPKNSRWRRRKDARPDEIIESALKCFGEKGFTATKLDEIAECAGVTKGTVYLYFDSKEDLFKAVVSNELVPNINKIERHLEEQDYSPSEALLKMISFMKKTLVMSKLSPLPKLVVSEVGNFPELAEFYLEEVTSRGFNILSKIILNGIETGEFRDVDVENTIYCVISPVLFSALYKHSLEPHAKKKLDTVSFFETHIEMVLRGLANDQKKKN